MNTILNNLFQSLHRPTDTTRGRVTNNAGISQQPSTGKSLAKRMLIACTVLGGLATPAVAQQEVSYLNTRCYDVKHYATSLENGGRNIAMAGTLFNYGGAFGNNAVHLLRDGQPFTQSVVYDDPNFDERTVGVHYLDQGNVFIVSTAIDYLGNAGTGNGIELIQHPVGRRRFVFTPTAGGQDLWPLGSLMDVNNRTIYVCGYVTNRMGPGRHPDYNTPKRAFVLRWNISNACVDRFMTYDWPASNPTGNDYDMAHRMKFLRLSTIACPRIWVGGSCNGSGNPAMMNMVIDGCSLNLAGPGDNPIVTPLIQDGNTLISSFDIVENLNGAGSSYIAANYFAPKSTPFGMMDPEPLNYNFTSVDANTHQPGVRSHAMFASFRYAWGTNTVPGYRPNSIILSGYQNVENCGLVATPNTDPFLVEPTLNSGGLGTNIVVGNLQWSTMLTAAGSAGFNTLGGGLSNLVHGPVTTILYPNASGLSNVVFNGPVRDRWVCSSTPMGMKYIETDPNLDPKCKFERCTPSYTITDARVSNQAILSIVGFACKEYTLRPDPLDVKTPDCATDFYYKSEPTAVSGVAADAASSISAVVYPNPAQDVIQVKLSGVVDASAAVKVTLGDIAGKNLSVLYQGTASGLSNSMSLPNLPRGIYTLTVTYGDSRLKSIPLVIN